MKRPKILDYQYSDRWQFPLDVEKYMDELERQNKELKKEIKVTDKLLEERQKVLDAIPECKTHGSCVPNALEWIEEMKKLKR
jgi:hypothetical protein